MDGPVLHIIIFSVLAGACGLAAGYFAGAFVGKRRLDKFADAAQQRLHDVGAERDVFAERCNGMSDNIESLQSTVANYRSKLKIALGNEKAMIRKTTTLAETVQVLHQERETTKSKVNSLQGMLVAIHQRSLALQGEFEKAGAFYKEQLAKSFRIRKALEQDLVAARAEQAAFQKTLDSSVKEHGSAKEMIVSAQLRLGQIEVLERTVAKLEAENAELAENAKQLRADSDALQRELAEMNELRIHNQQLVMAVEALESSRKEYEEEAEQYRDKADQSEQLSDTLRMKLADLESGFAAMEQEQNQVIRHVRDVTAAARPAANEEISGYAEMTQLVG
jgi:chromosome segregation ATPase